MEHLIGCIALESLFSNHLNIQSVEIEPKQFYFHNLYSLLCLQWSLDKVCCGINLDKLCKSNMIRFQEISTKN